MLQGGLGGGQLALLYLHNAETVADVWAWLRDGGEAELDEWRSEHRPPPMVEAAIALLEAKGVPEAHIYYDKFTTTADE